MLKNLSYNVYNCNFVLMLLMVVLTDASAATYPIGFGFNISLRTTDRFKLFSGTTPPPPPPPC